MYLLALFWPRCNEPGAFWGLMTGLAVGLLRSVKLNHFLPNLKSDKTLIAMYFQVRFGVWLL